MNGSLDHWDNDETPMMRGTGNAPEWLGSGALARVSRGRRLLALGVASVLIATFAFFTFRSLTQSDWLYGTYGQIGQSQWDRIADLRDRLVELGVAPAAVSALNDALLEPRPSTEDVLFDLQQAVIALESFRSSTARGIRSELRGLIAEIPRGHGPSPTPWFTPVPSPTLTPFPIYDAPLA